MDRTAQQLELDVPQDLLIPIAFPHRVNPDPLRAYECEQAWGRRYRVEGDGERLRRLAPVQPAKLTCYTYPDAHGRDLDLVAGG
ncbi:hypothetical protein [Streptomyces sp. NPDC096324]|uniref:hypothetical protein n=1 Tax=Streptomyces sp. NPDC096324 TaxID=3366085 RepID=UPI00382F5404